MDGNSLNITQDLLEKLKELVPQAFSEEKLDMQKLQTLLGEAVNTDNERYQLSWAGKSEAYKVLQMPTTATLIPQPEQSVNWDESENIFIEGENLEVLKVLQKSYYGKIKMIYIDPPYNTGSDSFIYPDKFSETKEEYLKRIGEKDEEGYMMKEGLFRKNSKENGQFHSNWLNMMLPRLFLARNLLKDDGVIFVSIDDNEQANLKLLMDEIFGEENFIGIFSVNSTPNARDYGHIGKMHEYVLFYCKNLLECETFQLPEIDKDFKYSDEIGGFNIHPLYNSNEAFHSKNRPNLFYPFYLNPQKRGDSEFYEISLTKASGFVEVYPPKSLKNDVQFVWRWGKEKAIQNLNKEILGYKTGEEYRIVQKMRHTSKLIRSLLIDKKYSSRRGTAEVEEIFGKKAFSFPKPISLIQDLVLAGAGENDIILDFFAGSGTTCQSILEQNELDGIKRKFICVQLSEPLSGIDDAETSEFDTISKIAEERVKKVIRKIDANRKGKLEFEAPQILGFRKYILSSSNFKIWRGDLIENEAELTKQMELFVTPQRANAQSENILWELLIKNGVPLTEKIQQVEVGEGVSIYHTSDKRFAFVLDKYTPDVQEKVLALKPRTVICLDSLFQNQDMVKTNAQLKFEDNDITFKTV